MIDFRLRNERLLSEAADPEVAVILLDVVLGYGAHPDPAGELVPAIEKAQAAAARKDAASHLSGSSAAPKSTRRDSRARNRRCAPRACFWAESNAQAVRIAAAIVGKRP